MGYWLVVRQRDFRCLLQRWSDTRERLKSRLRWLLLLALFVPSLCSAADSCTPAYKPPADPFVAEVNQCLNTVIFSINENEAGDYRGLGTRLVRAILENKAWSNTGPGDPISIERLVELIAILDSPTLINLLFGRFVNSTLGHGEEASIPFARLYAWKAPDVLRAINRHQGEKRKALIDALSFGIANLYWGHINKSNYRRMPIGVHWELLEKKHPLRSTVEEIEKTVREMKSNPSQ